MGTDNLKREQCLGKGGALQDLEQFLIEIFLLVTMIPVGLFCLPFDISLRVEIGECDTMSLSLVKICRPLSLMVRVQRRILKSSKSMLEKCSKINIFTLRNINMGHILIYMHSQWLFKYINVSHVG